MVFFVNRYARISYGVGNELLGTTELPYTFVVILPVYNETIELLTEGVKSILDSNYEKKNITGN